MTRKRPDLSLVAQGDPDSVAAAVSELRGRLPAMIEYQKVMARLQRETYEAYLREGFTPKQALELVKDIKP